MGQESRFPNSLYRSPSHNFEHYDIIGNGYLANSFQQEDRKNKQGGNLRFGHLFKKYFLSAHCMLGPVLGTGDTKTNYILKLGAWD